MTEDRDEQAPDERQPRISPQVVGGGVLAGIIVALYAGLMWFRRMADR